ncbi:MAG: hypothetical protein GXY89_01455 [Tissierellia bacterium]|nr:hypothetical protein [Tissierellia bacterium]
MNDGVILVRKLLIIVLLVLFLIPVPALASAEVYRYEEMAGQLVSQWALANESVTISFQKSGTLDKNAAIEAVWAEMKNDPAIWANLKQPSFLFKDRGNGIYDMEAKTTFHHNKSALQSVDTFAKDWAAKNINDGMGEFEKVQAIYNFIGDNYKYSYTNQMIVNGYSKYSPLSLIHNGEGVCNAFGGLFISLSKQVGIESIYIVSNAEADGSSHGWNLVKIDGNWYHIDPTWAVEDGESREMFFLKGDSFVKQHRSWNYGNYPAAVGNYK